MGGTTGVTALFTLTPGPSGALVLFGTLQRAGSRISIVPSSDLVESVMFEVDDQAVDLVAPRGRDVVEDQTSMAEAADTGVQSGQHGRSARVRTQVGTPDVDVVVAYAAGTTPAQVASIPYKIDQLNWAFGASGMAQRVRLSGVVATTYAQRFLGTDDLTNLAGGLDPALLVASAARENLLGDLLTLLVPNRMNGSPGPICGIGHLPGVYAVVGLFAPDGCDSIYTFAHELGHNHGGDHDQANVNGYPNPPYHVCTNAPHNCGHRVPGVARSVMAYGCPVAGPACPVSLHFSNPQINFAGTATPSGVTGAADNAHALPLVVPTTTNFRAFDRDSAIRIAAVDGAGDDVVVIGRSVLGQAEVWKPSGSSFVYQGVYATGLGSPYQVRVGDVSGDGKTDLMQFPGNGTGYLWTGTGTGFTSVGQVGTGFGHFAQIRVGDVNADGKADIFQFTEAGNGYVWTSNGTSFTYRGQVGSGFGSTDQVRLADASGDGAADVWQFTGDGRGYLWTSNGSTTAPAMLSRGLKGSGFGTYQQIQTADIDGDNDDDVFQMFSGSGYLWKSGGGANPSFPSGATSVGSGYGYVDGVRFGDMNGDNKDDIFQFTEGGSGYRWLSNGNGFGASAFVGSNFGAP